MNFIKPGLDTNVPWMRQCNVRLAKLVSMRMKARAEAMWLAPQCNVFTGFKLVKEQRSGLLPLGTLEGLYTWKESSGFKEKHSKMWTEEPCNVFCLLNCFPSGQTRIHWIRSRRCRHLQHREYYSSTEIKGYGVLVCCFISQPRYSYYKHFTMETMGFPWFTLRISECIKGMGNSLYRTTGKKR